MCGGLNLKEVTMSRVLILVSVVCAMMMNALSSSAESLEPMNSRVKTQVGVVDSSSGVLQLPVITWGGEYGMVYANGNSAATANGSIFNRYGLNFKISLQDDPVKQLEDYLSGRSPFFRGTLDMVNMIAEVTQDPIVKPVVFTLLTRSTNGDAVVVTSTINTVADFKGKRVALQSYGPHLYYLWTLLKSANLSLKDITIVWTKNLYGDDSPTSAMQSKRADVAFVIYPDALDLTAPCADKCPEKSVKGARILLTTKTASNVIFDVYVVRSDYFQMNREKVFAIVKGIMQAQDEIDVLMPNKSDPKRKDAIKAFAQVILGSKEATATAEGMYSDCTASRLAGNEKFFADRGNPRNFETVNAEIQTALKEYGLLKGSVKLASAEWNYNDFKAQGLVAAAEAPRFDEQKVAAVVTQRAAQGTLSDGQIFPIYSIYFQPNKESYESSLYYKAYDQVISDISKMGGALIIIEGHADPSNYIKAKRTGSQDMITLVTQKALNTSYLRAIQVRQAIINYAKSKGITIDQTQFSMVGHGFKMPRSGMCSGEPCPPKNEKEWLENMRVDFRLVQIEAESVEFEKL
jgi:outer membrane protein OmpA-like peptidoglycan-associated protein